MSLSNRGTRITKTVPLLWWIVHCNKTLITGGYSLAQIPSGL